jgi:uncharacterized protein YbjQ (UPF0145 family)
MLIVTTDGLPGYEIRNVLGEALGVAVRTDQGPGPADGTSSSTFRVTGDRPAPGLAAMRRQAVERLGEEARRKGANAVVGMCFDTVALPGGGHEVCAYGTAVWAETAGQTAQPGVPQDARQTAQKGHSGAIPQPQVPYGDTPQPGGPPMGARNLTIGLQDRQR